MKTIVQKYGGATLATPEKIKQVAKRISDLHKQKVRLVVVVSAMGQTTNELIQLSQKVSDRPHLRELDMLLTVGERISMSLLSMALNDLGCPAISFTGSQAGILTDESHVNAKIIDVKGFRVQEALEQNKVVIMAGFQGVSPATKEITTLGRGGSDISAVAMAGFLKADRCEILKDVDGVYSADPKIVTQAKRLQKISLQSLLEMTTWGAKVLNSQSVSMGIDKEVSIFVGPADSKYSEQISSGQLILDKEGTLVVPENHSNEIKPLAINSFEKVLKLKIFSSVQDFFNKLISFNISKPQLLLQKQNEIYISGPAELLNSLLKFKSSHANQSDFFDLVSSDLGSVSLTYNRPTDDQDLNDIRLKLKKLNVDLEESFVLMNSLHLILKEKDRINSIRSLHEMI